MDQTLREGRGPTSPSDFPPLPLVEPALSIQQVCIRSAATMSDGSGKEFTAFTIAVEVGGDVPGWEVKRRFRCISAAHVA